MQADLIINNKLINNQRVSKLGTIIAIVFLIHSIFSFKLSFGEFGLIHSLSLTFFLGIVLLLVSSVILWTNPTTNNGLIFAQLLIFMAGLWLTPFLYEHSPDRTSYAMIGFVDYIIRNGTLNPEVCFYHNWPAHSILFAILSKILGLSDPLIITGITPFFTNLFYFLALCLFRKFLFFEARQEIWWPFVWIFFIINFIGQDSFCPQGMAYFLFLMFIALFLLLQTKYNNYSKTVEGNILRIILFCSLTITHILTPIVIVIIILIFTLYHFMLYEKKVPNYLFILSLIVFVSWTTYGAVSYFEAHLWQFIREALNFEEFFQHNVARVGSTGDTSIDQISVFFTIIVLILSFAGWLITHSGLLKKCFTILSITPFILAPFFVYGGEILARVFLFLYLPVAFFSSAFLRNLKIFTWGISVFLVVAIPLHIISHYGNEEYRYVSSAERKAASFFFEKRAKDFEVVSENDPLFRQRDLEHFAVVLISASRWENEKITGPWSKGKDVPQYVAITRGTFVNYERFKGDTNKIITFENLLRAEPSYICIYSNNDGTMYAFKDDRENI